MDSQFLTTLILGFTLGLKHALDPDHVVAVSTIVSDERSLLRSAAVGISWGIGHTLTLLLVGLAVLLFRVTLPEPLALLMEFAVGVMLVILGLQTIWLLRRKRVHAHAHQHDGTRHPHFHAHPVPQEVEQGEMQHLHTHPGPEWRSVLAGVFHDLRLRRKSVLIGMVHGLAGSAALMLLVLATVRSAVQGFAYILIFGIGSVGGMLMISSLIGLPFALSAERSSWLNEKIGLAAGSISIGLGLVVMAEIGAAMI